MAQSGRKSFADISMGPRPTRPRPRLSSPQPLTKSQQLVFDLVVAKNRHLLPTDAPMVARFAIATDMVFRLAKTKDIAGWERACRVQAMYSTKLRISPQATTDPQSIGRRRKDDNDDAIRELIRMNEEKPWHFDGADNDQAKEA
jgi:hypothetical protein